MVHKDFATEIPFVEQVLEVDLRPDGDVPSEQLPSLLTVNESNLEFL